MIDSGIIPYHIGRCALQHHGSLAELQCCSSNFLVLRNLCLSILLTATYIVPKAKLSGLETFLQVELNRDVHPGRRILVSLCEQGGEWCWKASPLQRCSNCSAARLDCMFPAPMLLVPSDNFLQRVTLSTVSRIGTANSTAGVTALSFACQRLFHTHPGLIFPAKAPNWTADIHVHVHRKEQ